MPLKEFENLFPTLCRHLRQAKANDRTGQAYLLSGDDMEFLERFAMAWAQTAACTNPLPDGTACGHCEQCVHFQRGSYSEIYVVRPQSKSRRITVDDMRAFEHSISLSSRRNYLKIGMIVEAERLGDGAQNAFLKTLEEPPPGTMLLLLSTNPRMLLPTTKSRCQLISLNRNRQDYSYVIKQGLFASLALLHRNAGALAGLQAAAAISAILGKQRANAEKIVKENENTAWDSVDDPRILKQLQDEQEARVEAEYVKLREILTGAMQAWFLQRLLLAAGTPLELLPNPEVFDGLNCPIVTVEEATQDVKTVTDFSQCIAGNVDEALAIDAMCLTISEKCNTPKRG